MLTAVHPAAWSLYAGELFFSRLSVYPCPTLTYESVYPAAVGLAINSDWRRRVGTATVILASHIQIVAHEYVDLIKLNLHRLELPLQATATTQTHVWPGFSAQLC